MNRTSVALLAGALSVLAAGVTSNAVAATTSASAVAFARGTTVSQSNDAGAAGAQATASQVLPSSLGDAFVSAEASSIPGSLRAAGVARTNGSPGGYQGQASASWADSFVISTPAHNSSMTGTFSGAVQVTGGLQVEFLGRVYSDSQIYATVELFPGTGFNGGRTVVTGSARRLVGYDISGVQTGAESFLLMFSNVPFTFNQRIDVAMSLTAYADVNAIDVGVMGRSIADYSNTATWSGLSNVRDQNNVHLTNYTAISESSGFNFAPVPEPSGMLLLVCGLTVILVYSKRTSSIHDDELTTVPRVG